MRIALISPYSNGPMRGNITTVRRIARFLGYAGAETVDLAVDSLSIRDMERRPEDFKPDLIHGFHAHYCGAIARQLAERFQIPYVITITGSDIHDPLLRSYPATTQAIKAAKCVVCFNNNDADMLAKCFPQFGGEIIMVPQGVEPLPIVECENFGLASDAFILLLPAALRPVKRVEFPMQLLPTLLQHDPTLHLVIAGGYTSPYLKNNRCRVTQNKYYALSLVNLIREQGVASSNLVIPTIQIKGLSVSG